MRRIHREVGELTADYIQDEIRERRRANETIYEMGWWMAGGKAVVDVERHVKRLFREGGAAAVWDFYGGRPDGPVESG